MLGDRSSADRVEKKPSKVEETKLFSGIQSREVTEN